MRLNDNTIVITGGSSGIGLELSRVLAEKGNQVIICGRSSEKLEQPIDFHEVLMPAVDTPFHDGNPPKMSISAEKAVEEMLKKLEKGAEEIKIGGVKLLHPLSRVAPNFAVKKVNSL